MLFQYALQLINHLTNFPHDAVSICPVYYICDIPLESITSLTICLVAPLNLKTTQESGAGQDLLTVITNLGG